MIYRQKEPTRPFIPIVKCYWEICSDAASTPTAEPVLPDGCPEIVFNLADRFQRIDPSGAVETQAQAIVSGQLRKGILIKATGRVELFGVRFRPYGAGMFLGLPMAELTDQVISLDMVMRSGRLEERIAKAQTFEKRIVAFESHLALILAKAKDQTPDAIPIANAIIASGGRISVADLRIRFGFGERQTERLFARVVGLSPKMFSRVVRFQNVVRHLGAANDFDLVDSAVAFGYYDQSHMIREFREFAGKSPLAYFRETHRMSELFTAA